MGPLTGRLLKLLPRRADSMDMPSLKITFAILALATGTACASSPSKASPGGAVQTPTTATTAVETPTTATTALAFSSCAAAKTAGYHDIKRGDAGYSARLDADGDGVACNTTVTTVTTAAHPTTTVATAHKMTFAECQASAEYPGGRYAVDFDNGVCTIQKP